MFRSSTPRGTPRLRHAEGGGRAVHRGHPVLRLLWPHGPAGGSYEEIMASLKRLGQLEGDYHVCPGHDRTSTLERERQYNPFLREAMGQRS